MSDTNETKEKRTRSAINPAKILNILREEKGLPKANARPAKGKAAKLTKEQKEELARNIWADLYPASVTDREFEVTEAVAKSVVAEFEKRLKVIQGEVKERKPYTGKPRGRKPKSASV